MKKYIYRAHPGYENGQSVKCKDQNSTTSMAMHIMRGSTIDTKYISCTNSMSIATMYSFGNVPAERVKRNREPVVLIDTAKLSSYQPIYDTSEEPTKSEISTPISAANFAKASREVLTEIEIPADCMREMPLICIDMIRAFEVTGVRCADEYIETINDFVMSDDESFREALKGIKLEGELGEFYEEYYINGNTNLEEISKKMFNGDIELANCVRVQVIKEVFKNPQIMQPIIFGAYYKNPNMKIDASLHSKIEKYYVDTISEEFCSTAETPLEAQDKVVLGGLALPIKSERQINIPSGVRFEERDGKRYAVKQTRTYRREIGERPQPIGTRETTVELPEKKEETLDLASQLSTQISSDQEYLENEERLSSALENELSDKSKKPVDIIE